MTFINLSNHPVSSWSKEQVDAAVSLGLGNVVDLQGGMPLVDPAADEGEVAKMADDIAAKVQTLNHVKGAFVAGDFTLTFALVSRLKKEGIRCFCTTSMRKVVEEKNNENIIKKSLFAFVRWREYL